MHVYRTGKANIISNSEKNRKSNAKWRKGKNNYWPIVCSYELEEVGLSVIQEDGPNLINLYFTKYELGMKSLGTEVVKEAVPKFCLPLLGW
ncbi:hypothetical protein NPIL_15191 [Nephila pilipes]|uniref:Uncharacterized protein n=1 Tax=Nephila pilipes TaxID=299642 RepID=A0A8X6QXQ1_NEPPI|nr:hypothetical protein NPIL_15191 [Nephila pilipes]